jgi:hypothetical protein
MVSESSESLLSGKKNMPCLPRLGLQDSRVCTVISLTLPAFGIGRRFSLSPFLSPFLLSSSVTDYLPCMLLPCVWFRRNLCDEKGDPHCGSDTPRACPEPEAGKY